MINRERLKNQLKKDEGYRSNKYEDSLGKTTIGYGHRVLATDNIPIFSDAGFDGKQEAEKAKAYFDRLLDKDMDIAIKDAVSIIGKNHPPEVLEAFSNMAFQLGKTKLADPEKGFVNTIRLIKAQDYKGAAKEMLDSNWARIQTPERAKRVSKLMASAFKTDDAGPVGEMFRDVDMAQFLGRR